MRLSATGTAILLIAAGTISQAVAAESAKSYAVVVSNPTLADAGWRKVVDALVAKHQAQIIAVNNLEDAKGQLARLRPRYACFVATPKEAGREFVARVHRLTRQLDDDPYTDVLWGILTGYDAKNALRIAEHAAPLEINKVAAGTEIALDKCAEGEWYSELESGHLVRKRSGNEPAAEKGPADSTLELVDALNEYKADLFVTSGHATERDWQIGFRYRNGSFQCQDGKLFGLDTRRTRHLVDSSNPKVYLAVGNCLMGHVDGPDAMALAYMNSAGVHQMVGYTVLTWYGYGGWGLLDYFVEQPGRYTLAEAFFANHQALLHKLETEFPREARQESGENTRNGLLYDRDVVAFYGDPAWEARMKPANCAWDQKLTVADGVYRLTISPRLGAKTFEPVNTNGSLRGGRPVFALLPHRVKNVVVIEGQALRPIVTDDFLLVPLPKSFDAGTDYSVAFQAERAE